MLLGGILACASVYAGRQLLPRRDVFLEFLPSHASYCILLLGFPVISGLEFASALLFFSPAAQSATLAAVLLVSVVFFLVAKAARARLETVGTSRVEKVEEAVWQCQFGAGVYLLVRVAILLVAIGAEAA